MFTYPPMDTTAAPRGYMPTGTHIDPNGHQIQIGDPPADGPTAIGWTYKMDPYLRGQIEAFAQVARLKVQIPVDDESLVSLYRDDSCKTVVIRNCDAHGAPIENPREIVYTGSPQVILAYLHGKCGV